MSRKLLSILATSKMSPASRFSLLALLTIISNASLDNVTCLSSSLGFARLVASKIGVMGLLSSWAAILIKSCMILSCFASFSFAPTNCVLLRDNFLFASFNSSVLNSTSLSKFLLVDTTDSFIFSKSEANSPISSPECKSTLTS